VREAQGDGRLGRCPACVYVRYTFLLPLLAVDIRVANSSPAARHAFQMKAANMLWYRNGKHVMVQERQTCHGTGAD